MTVSSYSSTLQRTFAPWVALLLIVSLNGQTAAQDPVPVLELSAPADHPELSIHHPDVSPDGRFITASAGPPDFRKSTIWVFDRDTGAGRQLTRQDDLMNFGDLCPRWSPDGQSILFVSDRADIFGVYVVDVESAEMRLLQEVQTNSFVWEVQADWSPDGSKVVYPTFSSDLLIIGNQNLYTYRIEDGMVEQITDYGLLTSPKFPVWSDTSSIIYSTSEGQLLRIDPLTREKDIIYSGSADYFAFPRLSHDGDWIAYHSGNRTFLLPADEGGEPIEMKPVDGKQAWGPVWDGATSRLLYHEGGTATISVVVHDFEKEMDWEVVSMQMSSWGEWASWSPSGDRVAFLARLPDGQSGTKLIVADTKNETLIQVDADDVLERGPRANAPAWISDNVFLYIRRDHVASTGQVPPNPMASRILSFDVETMQLQDVVHERNGEIHHVAASHDTELLSYTLDNDIWIYDLLDQAAYELTLPDPLREIQFIQFSPNDDKLLFKGLENFHLYDLDTGDIDEIPLNENEKWNSPTAHWVNAQELLYAAGGPNQKARIYSYNVDTRKSLHLHGNDENEHSWRPFSVEQGVIFFQKGGWDGSLMQINTRTGDIQEVIDEAHMSVFAHDGSKVVYTAQAEHFQTVLVSRDVSYLLDASLRSTGPVEYP